jgi:hypothetical protein
MKLDEVGEMLKSNDSKKRRSKSNSKGSPKGQSDSSDSEDEASHNSKGSNA